MSQRNQNSMRVRSVATEPDVTDVTDETNVTDVTSPPSDERYAALAKKVSEALFVPVPGAQIGGRGKQLTKVTVVGVGSVGMACAQTMLTQGQMDELALIDVQEDKLRGEMLDLQHAASFLPRTTIRASTDYAISADSDLCIVTAGARQREGESRLSLVGRNVNLLKSIIPKLVQHSPHTTLLIISNPVDILSWAAWKISGLPSNRVIGSGTNLDSSRFRFLLGNALQVNPKNIHAYIIGEHGDSSVPLWSSVSIAGVPMLDFLRSRHVSFTFTDLDGLHRKVVDGAYEVIRLKGYTNWAIGYSVGALAESILRDQQRVQPVSVLSQGIHGIEEEVFLSLPSILGREGCLSVAHSFLSERERGQIQKSAKTLWEIQKQLDL